MYKTKDDVLATAYMLLGFLQGVFDEKPNLDDDADNFEDSYLYKMISDIIDFIKKV